MDDGHKELDSMPLGNKCSKEVSSKFQRGRTGNGVHGLWTCNILAYVLELRSLPLIDNLGFASLLSVQFSDSY